MFKDIVCPVSGDKIDRNVSQLTIFQSVILVGLFIYFKQPVYLYIAALDYFVRAFVDGQYSPLRFIANYIASFLRLKPRMIDKAPKLFASRVGFLCLLCTCLLFNVNMLTGSLVIAAFAGSLFLLDALGIVCVGCLMYHHLVYPIFYK